MKTLDFLQHAFKLGVIAYQVLNVVTFRCVISMDGKNILISRPNFLILI